MELVNPRIEVQDLIAKNIFFVISLKIVDHRRLHYLILFHILNKLHA